MMATRPTDTRKTAATQHPIGGTAGAQKDGEQEGYSSGDSSEAGEGAEAAVAGGEAGGAAVMPGGGSAAHPAPFEAWQQPGSKRMKVS